MLYSPRTSTVVWLGGYPPYLTVCYSNVVDLSSHAHKMADLQVRLCRNAPVIMKLQSSYKTHLRGNHSSETHWGKAHILLNVRQIISIFLPLLWCREKASHTLCSRLKIFKVWEQMFFYWRIHLSACHGEPNRFCPWQAAKLWKMAASSLPPFLPSSLPPILASSSHFNQAASKIWGLWVVHCFLVK